MIKITYGGHALDVRSAMHVTAPNAAQLQGTGLPASAATGTDAFGPVWRLRGKSATAEHDSAPPL